MWHDLGGHLHGAIRNAIALGDDERALDLIELQLLMGHDIARTGAVMQHLVGEGTADQAVGDVRHLLALGRLDASMCRRFADVLDRLDENRSPLSQAWTVASATTRGLVIHSLREPSPAELDVFSSVGWRHLFSPKIWAAGGLERLPGWLERLHPLDVRLPIDAWHEAQRIADEAEREGHEIVRMTTVIAPIVYRKRARVLERWNLLRVSTALAGYRAEHGQWPETLDDLVPEWLERVERCPATGRPLGYADGRMWASGGDGDDDGGRAQSEPDDWASDGDVVFDLNDKSPSER